VRQDVKKESPQELEGGERHGSFAIPVGIVLPGEGHVSAFDRLETVVGDCNAVGVAGEILENLVRTSEWGLAVDDPFPLARHTKELAP
jgi:hypothetical protein